MTGTSGSEGGAWRSNAPGLPDAAPVGSGALQKFNGTARPEHGADVAVIVALNGFTKPATEFAERHDIVLIGRPELKRWAHGEHLYAVVGEQHSPA
ncbi:restriction endonuclease [Streptomyces chengmaiensis]|uniref:restriction endonuclease n=1 Tax=Streptomyces chengmaiensis TaxID=3040919 RepID=UPI0029624FC9|nr:restriction endonuclease [Streptomyces chengmaiensis]